MATIIQEPEYHEEFTYAREFRLRQGGGGWAFDCTEAGELLYMGDAASENYRKCIDGTYDVEDVGVVTFRQHWTSPLVVRCDCGAKVYCSTFTNTCDRCGADYNMDGQRLASRSQWGEETGESLADILAIR